MDVVFRRVAGLDVHKRSVMACIRVVGEDGKVATRIRRFGAMTSELRNLRSWLEAQGVVKIAMEATGEYWKPVWNVLEEGFHEMVLCNPHHMKQVPGRKTDAKDCEWIAQLLQHGLLRASFVPSRALRELRDLTRTRAKLVDQTTRYANRIQKTLEDANIKLTSVASRALGKSGRDMIAAIIGGQTDPRKLALLARGKLRAKIPELVLALEGHVTEHHRFMLQLNFNQVLHVEGVIAQLDQRVERLIGSRDVHTLREDNLVLFPEPVTPDSDDEPPPENPPGTDAKPPTRADESPGCSPAPSSDSHPPKEAHPLGYAEAVALLCTTPGLKQRSAECILAEIGDDMSRFPTAGHLASWAGMAPGNNESAGKRKTGKTTKGNAWLRRALTQVAWAASRTKGTYASAQYRRLVSRRGKKRAIVAVGHSILIAIYHMLDRGVPYEDLGADYFDRRNLDRLTRYHVKRLDALGYKVELAPQDEDATAA